MTTEYPQNYGNVIDQWLICCAVWVSGVFGSAVAWKMTVLALRPNGWAEIGAVAPYLQ